MGVSRGEYLWFVDGDDELGPGALTTIVRRLGRDRPDVLVINHEDMGPDGLAVGQDDTVLARDDAAGCGPLARTVPGCWTCAWSCGTRWSGASSTAPAGARFLEEWPHEDVPVSCRLLLRAERISVLRDECYRFRRERPDSATKSGQRRRHFAVFSAWRLVLAGARKDALAADPAMPVSLYHRLFERAVWHCSTVLDARPEGATRTSPTPTAKSSSVSWPRVYRAFELARLPPPWRVPGGEVRSHRRALVPGVQPAELINRKRIEFLGRARSAFGRGAAGPAARYNYTRAELIGVP